MNFKGDIGVKLAALKRDLQEQMKDPKIWGADEPDLHYVLHKLAVLQDDLKELFETDVEKLVDDAREALEKLYFRL